MNRGLVLFLAVLLVPCAVSATGAGEERSAEQLQFVIMIKNGDDSWGRKEAAGFSDRCIELGVTPIVMDNLKDPNTTLANMDLAVEKKVDGIAIVIPDRKMGPVIAGRAFESNIAVVSLEHKLLDHQGRQLAPHIGIDDKAAGYAAGVWLAEEVEKSDWYANASSTVGIAGLTSSTSTEYPLRVNECQRALFEWLPELRENRFFLIEYPGTDAVGGLLAMQELLNQNPGVSNWIVFSATDEGAIGAVRALEQVGLGKYSIAGGIQAERTLSEFSLEQPTAFRGAVYFDPVLLGETAADALFRSVSRESAIPAVTTIDFRMLTRGNVPERSE